ncbi:MAG: S1 RNA-binding domain-containing protein, partial [Clostridiaceae bacterium]
EFEKEANKIIASRKAIEEDEAKIKKEELWDTIKVGEKRKGTVSRLAAFGAFVDLGGIDGLIHISELSWNRVKNASEVVSVGDEVEVTVLNADKEKNRISLSLKDINANPINEVRNSLVIGSIVEGTVRKIMDFGAFVEIKNGVDGLVHISQISEDRVTKISEFINVGDKVKVKILDIDKKSNKISLSIKDASEGSNEDYSQYQKEESVSTSLADLLKGFKFE